MNIFAKLFADATIPVCSDPNQPGCVSIPHGDSVTASNLLTNSLNIVYFILGLVAVVIIIISGYQFLTSNGEPEKAAKARQGILYAVIGLVVVVCAFAITNFIFGRVGQ